MSGAPYDGDVASRLFLSFTSVATVIFLFAGSQDGGGCYARRLSRPIFG